MPDESAIVILSSREKLLLVFILFLYSLVGFGVGFLACMLLGVAA